MTDCLECARKDREIKRLNKEMNHLEIQREKKTVYMKGYMARRRAAQRANNG